ncbi:hypothetical protein HYPSUDRAFT_92275, partial [Hypholoma sublateritium FD-334 SS-4]
MSLSQQAPILELNRDILWEIFGRSDSLNEIRRLSHVCWKWREILLESSTLWARNVDLDALDQKSDCWRNLVLERTGKAMLCVTGRGLVLSSKTPLFDFVADVLDKHWTRIRVLKIDMNLVDSDHERIRQAFDRPAANLQIFSYVSGTLGRAVLPQNLMPNFQLCTDTRRPSWSYMSLLFSRSISPLQHQHFS